MVKRIGILLAVTAAMVAIAVMQATKLPADARQVGEHWLKCYMVNQGLYSCRIYSKDKRLIKTQAFMLPYRHWRRDQRELTPRVREYDGDTISLDKGMKLLSCGVPYQAELIQSVAGPVWIKYEPLREKKNLYFCEVFSTKDGSIISAGAYDLKQYRWDRSKNKTVYEDVKETTPLINVNYYGGISISLKDKLVLMPSGVIDYATGPDSGLRVKYNAEGRETASEEY